MNYQQFKPEETLAFINSRVGQFNPQIGIILGTGLGGLVREVGINHMLDYKDIPHFPISTVESHHGNLIFGTISGCKAVIMQGRFHYYEGYSMYDVTYPIRIMHMLGIQSLLVSNACGAVNPLFKRGDLMIMSDHINFLFDTPFKNQSVSYRNRKLYSDKLISIAEKTALENEITIKKGVYCSLRGPCLETRAEYRMLRKLGADVVGMSTIPEALLSNNFKLNVLGFSIITDVGFPDSLKPAVLEEILEAAAETEPQLTSLMKKILEKLK
ncbi:MAG: purine-nucleoside phosphorylase [Ignavibacteriae bacterium]|nr:MAG: purine-nucleoside phosphorylase [Ignavibacteriota bacterium]